MKILNLLFDNFLLKIFSLVVATGIWFFVVVANKPEINFVVPLEFENIPQNMELLGEADYEVEVRVKGAQSLLSTLSSRQIKTKLDLAEAKAGETIYYLSSHNITLPLDLQASKISPQQVTVKLEPIIERLVPIEPLIVGVPAEGYELKGVKAFPETVRVKGAQSKVEELKSIRTASLNIAGSNTAVKEELDLVLPATEGLSFADGSLVEVRVIIAEKTEERQWENIPIKIIPVSWKAVIEPVALKVVASGPISKIRALSAADIAATVDLSELKPEQVHLEVKLQLPADAGIELVSKEPTMVKVISIEKPPQDELLRPPIGGSIPKAP